MPHSAWTRDAGGYYFNDRYPLLLVRSTNQTGYCKWEVARMHRRDGATAATSLETVGRYHMLADAKKAVETEGAGWSERATV